MASDQRDAFAIEVEQWRRESADCGSVPVGLGIDKAVVLLAIHDHYGTLRETCMQRQKALDYLTGVQRDVLAGSSL